MDDLDWRVYGVETIYLIVGLVRVGPTVFFVTPASVNKMKM
jgi:hypothetical protein